MPHPLFPAIALIGRPQDARVAESMLALAGHLVHAGAQVMVEKTLTLDFGASVERLERDELAARARLAIAIGGDGTMLHAARLVAERPVPLLGINRGRLGFLADISPDTMLESVDEILQGQYTEENRTLLLASLPGVQADQPREGKLSTFQGGDSREMWITSPPGAEPTGLPVLPALNDVVLQKGDAGKLLDFETWIDDRYVNTHSGDGLVVATATGSTAYALSCGGPIVYPELGVLVLAPICPHTLSDRPVIVPGGVRVEIRLVGRPESRGQVVCDGVQLGEIQAGERLLVQPSPNKIKLLHPRNYDYYRLLRSKLHWGRGAQNEPAPER